MKSFFIIVSIAVMFTNSFASNIKIPVSKRTIVSLQNNGYKQNRKKYKQNRKNYRHHKKRQHCWEEKRKIRVNCRGEKRIKLPIGSITIGHTGHRKKCYDYEYVTKCENYRYYHDDTYGRYDYEDDYYYSDDYYDRYDYDRYDSATAYINCGYYRGREYCKRSVVPLEYIVINRPIAR